MLIPIVILISQSIVKLDNVKNLSNETSKNIVEDQTARICISEAQHIAKEISDFLTSCELDVEVLSELPINSESYLEFSEIHKRWVNSLRSYLPLYKEIAYIDGGGNEIVKIVDNKVIQKEQLKNVSIPANTTFKSERYFNHSKKSESDIYVSHLTGWYVSRQEQLNQGKHYVGVFRFCKKIIDKKGNFKGICMIALDHYHIMDFIWRKPLDRMSLLNNYKVGNYNYIIDDEGWIIAHPKLWDIRGLDKNGNLVKPLSRKTPKWKLKAGLIPINLMDMDWRLRDIYTGEPMSNIIKRVQRGETVRYTMTSSGIYGETSGITRTRACAPIHYSTDGYKKYGIWGAVVVGKAMGNLLKKTKTFTCKVENISKKTKTYMIFLALIISLAVLLISFLIARIIARTMLKLNNTLIDIGQGNYDVPNTNSHIKEILDFFSGIKKLSIQLKEKDKKIKQSIKELETLNVVLGKTHQELDSYWKYDYEIESTRVLKEKIESYEKEYPRLKDIRKNSCIGNSPQFLRVLRQIVPLSQMTIPVWIYGESGVGKTALARVMHFLSPRNSATMYIFEAVEFSAADPMIVLGKLFGYGPGHGIRGITTDGQKGILEECDGGTLIIDDVDALPLETQAKLLRVVDGLSFHPAAGKTTNITSDIRFIFVTNVDLEQKVRQGLFRKDLFRRMGGNINKIEIPPLRERKSDIALLVNNFISNYNKENNIQIKIADDVMGFLSSLDYKEGNIGELKMIIELACEKVRIEGSSILEKKYLPVFSSKTIIDKPKDPKIFSLDIFNKKENRELSVLRKNHFYMEISEQELGYKTHSRTLSHHLRGMCLKALSHSAWNVEEAAKLITNSQNNKVYQIIKMRIEGYIENITKKGMTNQESSLYKNLPKEYQPILREAITQFKKAN